MAVDIESSHFVSFLKKPLDSCGDVLGMGTITLTAFQSHDVIEDKRQRGTILSFNVMSCEL